MSTTILNQTAAAYECSTNTRTFCGTAAQVARVAVTWAKNGETVGAYAILDAERGVTVREVPVTTVRATTDALKAAQ